jgi:hypothetical protein
VADASFASNSIKAFLPGTLGELSGSKRSFISLDWRLVAGLEQLLPNG